ncbi:hypothetical protein K1X76_04035 [bacterium]|nr:hypothetical protein [bacterium]
MTELKKNNKEMIEKLGKNAKRAYATGLKVVKDSFKGMEVVAGKTMEVTKLNLKNQKNLKMIESLFLDLGQRIYNIASHQADKTIPITADIQSFIDQIKRLHGQVEQNTDKLKTISTVKK